VDSAVLQKKGQIDLIESKGKDIAAMVAKLEEKDSLYS
jgi:hypothetical protein